MTIKVIQLNLLRDLSHWEERRPLIVKGAAEFQPDLFTVQEVNIQGNVIQWLSENLKMPYYHLTPKTGEARNLEGIGILSRHPFQKKDSLDLRHQNRVAQYVKVEVDGKTLVLANGHFYWPTGESEIRQEQVDLLLDWLDEIPGDPPVIMCGDFNATPDTASIAKMKARFKSAYETIHGKEPDKTNPTSLPISKPFMLEMLAEMEGQFKLEDIELNWPGTLDYIFFNDGLKVLDARLYFTEPKEENSDIYASDHFGLAAEFEFA